MYNIGFNEITHRLNKLLTLERKWFKALLMGHCPKYFSTLSCHLCHAPFSEPMHSWAPSYEAVGVRTVVAYEAVTQQTVNIANDWSPRFTASSTQDFM